MEEFENKLVRKNERIDDLQCGGFRLIQNPERFCFGIDAVLLSNYARIEPNSEVLDMCTGNGIIPVLLAAKTKASKIYGIEIQSEMVEMASRSIKLNEVEDRVEVIEGDVKCINDFYPKSSMDYITCNPPYMIEKHGIKNENDSKTIARHEILCNLEDIINAAAKTLKPGGNLYMVHRPFRLTEILVLLREYKLEPKRMRLVYPYADREPNMVLIEAKRGGKSRLTVESPLVVYKNPGEYTEEIYKIYGKQ